MKRRNRTLKGVTVGIATMMGYAELAHGGWTGGVNGLGNGWTQGSVVSGTQSSAVARTPFRAGPTASVPALPGFTYTANLPSGAQAVSTAWAKAAPGLPYNISAYATVFNGDHAGSKEIEAKGVIIKPAKCPSLTMTTSQDFFDPNTGTGSIKVNTQGTAGAAALVRGFEVEDWTLIPSDDPNTPEDESLDWVKLHGVLKFESFFIGPFNYGDGTCELILPFTLEGKNTDNFIVTTDGAVYSEPTLHFTCPPDQTVACLTGYEYPSVAPTSECSLGPVQSYELKYEPAESDLKVGDNTVTLTVTELLTNGDRGVSGTCTFKVTVLADRTFVGFYDPLAPVGGSCSSVAKTIKIGSKVPIKFDFGCGSTFITTGPAPVVKIQQLGDACQVIKTDVVNAEYQNGWHHNWETGIGNWPAGVYRILVVLPGEPADNESHYIYVRLKK